MAESSVVLELNKNQKIMDSIEWNFDALIAIHRKVNDAAEIADIVCTINRAKSTKLTNAPVINFH